MTEYLIAFNDEWVPDHTVKELREKSKAVRALAAEMKAAGVFIFTGGLDDAAPVFKCRCVERHAAVHRRSVHRVHGAPVVDVADEEAARLWAGKIAVACDWPQEVQRFRAPCNFRRLLNGVGGRSCREALLRVLVGTTSSTSRRIHSGTAATPRGALPRDRLTPHGRARPHRGTLGTRSLLDSLIGSQSLARSSADSGDRRLRAP